MFVSSFTPRFEIVDLFLYDGLGKAEFGDPVFQNAARKVKRFEHGDVIAAFGKVACAGQPRGAAAHDRDFVPVRFRFDGQIATVRVVPVCDEAFQPAYAHGLALDAAHALCLALRLLRAHPAAYRGKGTRLLYDLIRLFESAFGDFRDKLRDADLYGAAAYAGHVFAVQAALCLVDRRFG